MSILDRGSLRSVLHLVLRRLNRNPIYTETEMYRPRDPRQESALSAGYRGRTIVLIGPTGVGKSTVGEALARRLELPFADSDQTIIERHGPITEIFVAMGEPAFRKIESEAISSLLRSQSRPIVLSVGGGAILDPCTRQLFSDLTVVWLDTELEYVLPRLIEQPNRPLLRGDIAEKWAGYAAARYHIYSELADLKIDARIGDAEEMAETVTLRLLERF